MMKVKVIQETDRGIWPNSDRKWNWISPSLLTAVCVCECVRVFVHVCEAIIKPTMELGSSQLPCSEMPINREETVTAAAQHLPVCICMGCIGVCVSRLHAHTRHISHLQDTDHKPHSFCLTDAVFVT